MANVYQCKFCGEQGIGQTKYCKLCKSKPLRKEQIIRQLEIEKEQVKHGCNISDYIFGVERMKLLKDYKL